MEKYVRLPDAELEVMQALWAQKEYPVSSGALMEALAEKRWRLPTLLKLLSRLEERGYVAREKDGRANLYRPLVAQADCLAAETRSFLARLHAGSLPGLVAALVDGKAVDEAELRELEMILKGGRRDG